MWGLVVFCLWRVAEERGNPAHRVQMVCSDPSLQKKPWLSKCNPASQVTNTAERQGDTGLISGSKDTQNKQSLLVSAHRHRLSLPCSNRTAAPQPTSHLQPSRGCHIRNYSIYKTQAVRALPGAQGGLLVPTSMPAVQSGERWKPLGMEAGKKLLQMGSERRGSSTEKGRGRSERGEESSAGTTTCDSEWCWDRLMLCSNTAAQFWWLRGLPTSPLCDGSFASPHVDAWAALASAWLWKRQRCHSQMPPGGRSAFLGHSDDISKPRCLVVRAPSSHFPCFFLAARSDFSEVL